MFDDLRWILDMAQNLSLDEGAVVRVLDRYTSFGGQRRALWTVFAPELRR